MIVISDDFKNSVSKTEREMKGYVEVTYSSSEAKENASVTNFPDILQIDGTDISADGIIDDDRKGKNYASLEQDYFKLDGTFVLPNNDASKNPGMGYVSDKTFENDSYIPFTPFTISTSYGEAETVNGITMYFQNNKPLNLEVQVTSGVNVQTFTDIDISETGVATLTFSDRVVDIVRIYVKDVMYPDRRIRLQEVDFGLSTIYEGEDLISFKTIEQCNRFADEIPINECEVVLGDYTGKFDINNPNGITQYLGENVLVKPFVGVVTEDNGIEYCTLGTYWLDEWKNDKSSATLMAKDIFNKLNIRDTMPYYSSLFYNGVEHGEFEFVKSEAWNVKINNEISDNSHYVITEYTPYDPDLPPKTISIDQNYHNINLRKDTLQKFAVMMGNTFVASRYGEIRYIDSQKFNVVKQIGKNTLNENSIVSSKNKIKEISVNEYTYIVSKSNAGKEILATKTINANGITELSFDLEKAGAIEILYTGNPTIIDSNISAIYPESQSGTGWRVAKTIYIKFNYVGDITFTVKTNGNDYLENINKSTRTLNKVGDNIEIDNDFLTAIKSARNYAWLHEHGTALVNYRINNWNEKQLSCKFNGDPSIELGDTIEVENKYLDENNDPRYDKVWITKIESEFKGSFNQTIEGDVIEQ